MWRQNGMMKINFDNEIYIYGGSLQHHGIDGQKWGVKNGPPYPLDSSKPSRKERRRDKRKENRELKKKDKELKKKIQDRKYLSDEEIDLMIKRLSKEKELRDLYLSNNPKSKEAEKGKAATKDALRKVGSSVFSAVAKTVLTGAVLYGIGRAVSVKNEDLARSMVSGKAVGIGKKDD